MAEDYLVRIPGGRKLARWAVRKIVQPLLGEDELLESFWTQFAGGSAGPRRDELRSNQGWIYGANRQIAGRASRVDTKLFMVDHDVAGKTVETQIFNHPLLDLIKMPNPDEPGLLFHWRQILQLQTVGVSYAVVFPSSFEINRIDQPRAHPVVVTRIDQMRLLEPDKVSVFADEGRMAGRFVYRLPSGDDREFRPAPVSPAEVKSWTDDPYPYVFRVLLPSAGSYGPGGPSRAVTAALNNLDSLGRLHWNQLKNGVHAGLIFSILAESENPERFKTAVAMLKMGIGQAGEPMVLPKNRIEVSESPANNQEMQFGELGIQSRHEALAAMGGSDALIGMAENVNRCYDEETQCLTSEGWVNYTKLTVDSRVAAYDPDTKTLKYEKPLKVHRYRYDGEMVRFAARETVDAKGPIGPDLLVTPNHRMLVRRSNGLDGDTWTEKRADEVEKLAARAWQGMTSAPLDDTSPEGPTFYGTYELPQARREEYHGAVWCVTTSTGWIVVRRNGQSPVVSGNSNLWTMEFMLATGTVDPLNDLIAASYNAYLAPRYPLEGTSVWKLMYGSSAKLDEKDQVDIDVLRVNSGILTPNEIREKDNVKPHPDGDKLRNFTPGVDNQSDAEFEDQQDDELGNDTPGTGQSESDEDRQRLLWSPDSRAELWSELARGAKEFENTFESTLSEAYIDMGEEVETALDELGIQVLRSKGGSWHDHIRTIGDWWDETRWQEAFRALHSDSSAPWIASGLASVVSETGIDPEVMALGETESAVYTTSRAFEFSEEVTRTTKAQLTEVRDKAIAEGLTYGEFRDNIRTKFSQFRKGRAVRQAITEVNAGLNWATSLGIRIVARFGLKIRKMWLSSRDALVRDTHSVADGQMRNSSELFNVGGCQMMQPLDSGRCSDAAEIVWCRCRVWPVLLR